MVWLLNLLAFTLLLLLPQPSSQSVITEAGATISYYPSPFLITQPLLFPMQTQSETGNEINTVWCWTAPVLDHYFLLFMAPGCLVIFSITRCWVTTEWTLNKDSINACWKVLILVTCGINTGPKKKSPKLRGRTTTIGPCSHVKAKNTEGKILLRKINMIFSSVEALHVEQLPMLIDANMQGFFYEV